MRSSSSPLAVSMMIGVRSPPPRRRLQTAMPSSCGIIQSSTIRCGGSRSSRRQLARVRQAGHAKALFGQKALQQITQALVVVDDENMVRSTHGGNIPEPRKASVCCAYKRLQMGCMPVMALRPDNCGTIAACTTTKVGTGGSMNALHRQTARCRRWLAALLLAAATTPAMAQVPPGMPPVGLPYGNYFAAVKRS